MDPCRGLSGKLARIKPLTLIIVGILLMLLMCYCFLVVLPEIRVEVGQPEFEVVDAYYIRPPSMTFSILETMGAKGRRMYMRIASADVFIPFCFATLLGGLMAKAWGASPTPKKHGGPLSC